MDTTNKLSRSEQATQNFYNGYNCAQAVMLAFEDILPIDAETAIKLISPFGGGMGRMREVCGAVSGMLAVLGAVEGYTDPADKTAKVELYKRVQALAAQFRERNGSIVCRELLGVAATTNPQPEARTSEYYKKRPCAELVGEAAGILDDYLSKSALLSE